jgi:hypothetical protein
VLWRDWCLPPRGTWGEALIGLGPGVPWTVCTCMHVKAALKVQSIDQTETPLWIERLNGTPGMLAWFASSALAASSDMTLKVAYPTHATLDQDTGF